MTKKNDYWENEHIEADSEDESIALANEQLGSEQEKIKNELEHTLLAKQWRSYFIARERFINIIFEHISSEIQDEKMRVEWLAQPLFHQLKERYEEIISILSNNEYDDTAKLAFMKIIWTHHVKRWNQNREQNLALVYLIEKNFLGGITRQLNSLSIDSNFITIHPRYSKGKLKDGIETSINWTYTQEIFKKVGEIFDVFYVKYDAFYKKHQDINSKVVALGKTGCASTDRIFYTNLVSEIEVSIDRYLTEFKEKFTHFCSQHNKKSTMIGDINTNVEYTHYCDVLKNRLTEAIAIIIEIEKRITKQNENLPGGLKIDSVPGEKKVTPDSVKRKKQHSSRNPKKVTSKDSKPKHKDIHSSSRDTENSPSELKVDPANMQPRREIQAETDERNHEEVQPLQNTQTEATEIKHEIAPQFKQTCKPKKNDRILNHSEYIWASDKDRREKQRLKHNSFLERLFNKHDKNNKITINELEKNIVSLGGKVTVASKASHRIIELPQNGKDDWVAGHLLESDMENQLMGGLKRYGTFFRPHGSKDRSKGLLTAINRDLAIDAFTRAGYTPNNSP